MLLKTVGCSTFARPFPAACASQRVATGSWKAVGFQEFPGEELKSHQSSQRWDSNWHDIIPFCRLWAKSFPGASREKSQKSPTSDILGCGIKPSPVPANSSTVFHDDFKLWATLFRCFLALLPFDCLFDSFSILSMGPGEQGRGAYLLGQPSSSSSRSFVFSMFLMQRTDSFEKTLMLGKIEGGRRRGQQRMRLLDGITDSETGVRVSSRSWWWTGRPGVLRFMGSQRVRHNWVTELNWGFKKSITAKLLLFFVV